MDKGKLIDDVLDAQVTINCVCGNCTNSCNELDWD